ncbi:MAG: MarR family winged helix-turn-helix transcriptional regulator [Candidatus Omnitrophota bacterium]
MPPSLDKLDQFSRKLVEILPLMFREISKRENNVLTRGKITFPQMVALDYVSRKTKVKMTELARVLSIKMSSATVLVDRLIREKFFARSRDEADRRLVWVSATARGRKLVAGVLEQKRRSMKQIFASLTDQERQQYLSVMEKVKSHLLSDLGEKQ